MASLANNPPHAPPESDDEDTLIASLEAEDDNSLAPLRERRLEQLHKEFQAAKAHRNLGHGTYDTVSSSTHSDPERAVLDITTSTSSPRCVVHFFQPDFRRCQIMDSHLKVLAEKHLEARFVRVDVGAVPFLVERLKVRVLPCLIAFVGGKSVDRVIGFEGVGRSGDSFKTPELERRLVGSGVLQGVKMEVGEGVRAGDVRLRAREKDAEDDDGWDD